MTENFELYSFPNRNKISEDDIQEYHEINQDTHINSTETAFHNILQMKPLNDHDFFVKFDVKITTQKVNTTKKKSKKKEKPSNLMDIITSELSAAIAPTTSENIITMIDHDKGHQSSYLETVSRRRLFKYKPRFDSEYGWGRKALMVNLSPIFPRVLENTIIVDHAIPVQYENAAMYSDIILDIKDNDENQNAKFLDINIKNIHFNHHHAFSLEKILCVKLVHVYNEYVSIQRLLKDLSRDIKVNRETKENLKQDLLKISTNNKENLRFDQTIRKYTGNLIDLKERYINTLHTEKHTINKIISLWSDIEMIREKTDITETSFRLDIAKKIIDQNEFEKAWTEIFNIEFIDMLDKLEYDYISKYIEYKEAKSKQKLDNAVINKAIKPRLHFNEDFIREDVEKLVNSMVMKEKINMTLETDENIKKNLSKTGEKMLISEYTFEIYVDDVFVCKSDSYSSTENIFYDIDLNETFSVEILPSNTKLTIVLLENDEQVSYLKFTLSEIKESNTNVDFIEKTLVFEGSIDATPEYVGSGHSIKEIAAVNKIRLKSSNLFKGNLYTSCVIKVKVEWNENLYQNHSETIKSSMHTGRQLKRLLHGIDLPNIEILSDILGKMYGKDVSCDEEMVKTLSDLCKTNKTHDDIFAFDENSPEFIRFKLLHLRNIGGFTNVDNRLIPLHASQISTEQLNCLQKTNEKEFDMNYLHDKQLEMDPIELQRYIGGKYVQKLNKNMLKNLNEYLLKKTHKDVVRDFKDLSLRGIFSNQSNLASLAAISSSTKRKMLNESLSKEQDIHVTVIRAFNLLDRTTTILEDNEDEDTIAGFKVRPLRPFVRVNYRGVTVQTVTAIGCHPTWNHTVKLTNKLEPLSSININLYDECKSNITEGYTDEDQSSGKTVHYRFYNKWLGTLNVPLHTVMTLGSLCGTFKISTPPVLFGYETLQNKETTSLIPEIAQLMKKDTAYITLNITTNLAHLGGLQAYNQPLPSSIEDDYLIKHLNMYVTAYFNDFPQRNISLTFIDSAGRNKCVTQFLQPIVFSDDALPKNPKARCESAVSKSSGFSRSSSSKSSGRRDVEKGSVYTEESEVGSWRKGENELSRVINACLRYVALIPTYEVTESHVVILIGMELLKVLHGSPLDHTILLASYFLYLGIKCWVVIGQGLPRGQSSYVLIKYDLATRRIVQINDQLFKNKSFMNKSDGYMWFVCDATSGERHELRDVGCPLKTVEYVFDNENIWVNVQTSQDCESMSFDFSRSSDWTPVFDKSVFVMKLPIVSDISLYTAPLSVEVLRHTLDTKIRGKVQKWRTHMKTIWNRYCSGVLREVLPQWEYWAFNSSDPKPGLSHKLKQLMVTYKMFGFPLNMPYVNTKSVLSAVKSTSLHVNDDPNVEFALGVEVFAYPNNVISVWVFLSSITRM